MRNFTFCLHTEVIQTKLNVLSLLWVPELKYVMYLLYYTIPSTQHKSQSYLYMFRLNKSPSGVSCVYDTPEDDLLSRNM